MVSLMQDRRDASYFEHITWRFHFRNWISASLMPILLLCQRQHVLPNKMLKNITKNKGISSLY